MLEIERKYLVTSDSFKSEAVKKERILQGFLNTHPDRTVRVRLRGVKGFLTIKGRSNQAGTIRSEWETSILQTDAESLLKLCEDTIIEKMRHYVPVGNHIFEVDEFSGYNSGLVIAEVELKDENEYFEKPKWLGREVTGELRYYNSQLSKDPYCNWEI